MPVKAQESDQANIDPLVVVVNAQSATDSLDKKQLIDIFMGRFKNFPNGDGLLVDKSERKIDAYWSRLLFSGRATPPKKASSVPDIIQIMKDDVNALAYINASNVTKEMKIVYRFE